MMHDNFWPKDWVEHRNKTGLGISRPGLGNLTADASELARAVDRRLLGLWGWARTVAGGKKDATADREAQASLGQLIRLFRELDDLRPADSVNDRYWDLVKRQFAIPLRNSLTEVSGFLAQLEGWDDAFLSRPATAKRLFDEHKRFMRLSEELRRAPALPGRRG